MQRIILKSKIHRARITDKNLNYEGSITIDKKLMMEANLLPFEQVSIYNINNGERFDTYVIEGKEGSGDIIINGAAARLAEIDDIIIVASYAMYTEDEIKDLYSLQVYVDDKNQIKDIKKNKVLS